MARCATFESCARFNCSTMRRWRRSTARPDRDDGDHRVQTPVISRSMITVIDIATRPRTRVADGHIRNVLEPSEDGTRVHVAIKELDARQTSRIAAGDRTQVVYILEGNDARIVHTR